MEFTKVTSNIPNAKIFFLVVNAPRLNCRAGLLEFFTVAERKGIPQVPDNLIGEDFIKITGKQQELNHFKDYFTVFLSKDLEVKKIHFSKYLTPAQDRIVYGVYCPPTNGEVILMKLQDNGLEPAYRYSDRFELVNGMIQNYTGEPIITDVGKFVLNQFALVNSVGDLIPYINRRIDPSETDSKIAKLILTKKIGRKEYNRYMANTYGFGEDGSITVPCWSERSIGTDPRIAQRKKELFAQLKSDIVESDKIAKIEAELVAMDKAWLKGDVSEGYWGAVGGKGYSEERKKNYISWGMTRDFATAMGFVFVEESLEQGWNQRNVQIAANDVRKGSYERSKGTAKGGAETKMIMRVFQGIQIAETDCGTKQGLHVLLTESNYKQYADRYLMNGEVTTVDFLKQNIGKEIVIRSPMFCKSKGVNYCFKCCGKVIEDTGVTNIGLNCLAIGSQFLLISMKALHVGSVKVLPLNGINRFLR